MCKGKMEDAATYKLGQTRDEKFCIIDIKQETLVSWFMTTNDDSVVERWMMYRKFPLHPIVKEFTGWKNNSVMSGWTLWQSLMALCTSLFSTARTWCILSCIYPYAWKHQRSASSLMVHIGIMLRPISTSWHGLPPWYKAR